MKVLHIIPSVSPVHGGPSKAIVEMERALSALGVEVTTVSTNDDGNERLLDVRCGVPVQIDNATRWYFPRATVFYKYSPEMSHWLGKQVANFDVVHAHGLFSHAPIAAARASRHAQRPYILRPLGLLAPYGMTKRRAFLKQFSFSLVEKPLIEAAGAIHFTSEQEREEAEALGLKCRSAVIPLGINVGPDPKPILRGSGPLEILCVMRLDPKKNIEGALRALVLVPSVRLSIAGNGDADYVRSLKALADVLGISDRIEWLGYVAHEKKDAAFARADVFLLPSYSENFGIAAVEALSHGLPCIITREIGVGHAITSAGAGISVETSPQDIAQGIIQLQKMSTSALRSMAVAARNLAVNDFSLEIMGRRLHSLYRDLMVPQVQINAQPSLQGTRT